MTALWKDQMLDRLEPAPMDRDGVEALLVAVLGGPVDGQALTRLWSATGGNMLLLRELLLAATLRLRDGVWRLDDSWSVPPRLTELVEDRLGALPDDRRRVLELLAFGEPPRQHPRCGRRSPRRTHGATGARLAQAPVARDLQPPPWCDAHARRTRPDHREDPLPDPVP
ncbi:hypothetical protein AB0I60_02995 [Actinosynnema sp. NPDC050436]|uniref:hypothetical protein n=1 Tax=Actinosynnema sp. NPDC050436 TaxID=3155659 RepID=UPI0033D1C9BA